MAAMGGVITESGDDFDYDRLIIGSGFGVSVVFANTLYRASPEFFANPQWRALKDWESTLAPHSDTAERMLGVKEVPRDSDGQRLLREVGREFGVEGTFRRTPVGVCFGDPGRQVADPYFGGDGYAVTTQRPGAWFCKMRQTFRTRGIVLSAGALCTNRLLARARLAGSLPRISERLGQLVRTNSESIRARTRTASA